MPVTLDGRIATLASHWACAALLTTVAACSKPDRPMTEDIDNLMQAYAGDVPGAAVLVLQDGAPVIRKGYGFADLEQRTPITPATNFRLASVTKQFTAAAILLLMEDGRLALDDRVRVWLPSLPAVADGIKIRHLLTHTSGIIDYEDVIPESMTAQLHDADVLTLLETQDQLYFEPGTSYRYSNSGYALLALIVGKASGQSFARFLEARIFDPLGMTNTVAHEEGISTVAHRAFGYSLIEGAWQRTDQSQTSAVLGDGGIYSSIDDLAKWDAALYDERLLKKSSLDAAFAPATPTDALALGGDDRISQRDRALAAAPHDGRRADESQRSAALWDGPRHCRSRRCEIGARHRTGMSNCTVGVGSGSNV
jgi:CubicO group peptidase (beta-lactamase class C family)